MAKYNNIKQQLAKNSLSLISLVIAIIALTYNSWRANTSEINRNYRGAAFELILQMGKLQSITDDLHYNIPNKPTNSWFEHKDKMLIQGWGHIALIEDLSALLPAPFNQQAIEIKEQWQKNHRNLGESAAESEKLITASIKDMRQQTRHFLKSLE